MIHLWHSTSKILFVILLIGLCGCTSVQITPNTIAASRKPKAETDAAVSCLYEAVELANAFLASDFRKTLPAGRLTLHQDGLVFAYADRTVPVVIKCSWAGDILIPFKMAAQERSNGFVVGLVPPAKDRAIDNSFFKRPKKNWMENWEAAKHWQVAELLLHELTHQVLEQGTVSFGKGLAYYAESVFLFRYRNHSMERLPFRTNDEFVLFIQDYIKRQNVINLHKTARIAQPDASPEAEPGQPH